MKRGQQGREEWRAREPVRCLLGTGVFRSNLGQRSHPWREVAISVANLDPNSGWVRDLWACISLQRMQLIALFLCTHFLHKRLCLPFIRTLLMLRVIPCLLWVWVLLCLSLQEFHTEDSGWGDSRKSQPVSYTPFPFQSEENVYPESNHPPGARIPLPTLAYLLSTTRSPSFIFHLPP